MPTFSRTLRRHVLPLLAISVVWFGLQSVALACPTCAEGMTNDPHHANLVRGYFWSIIFMMSMPFLIFTTLCSYFYYEVRRARALQGNVARPGQIALGTARSTASPTG